jgi:hypothetical protein
MGWIKTKNHLMLLSLQHPLINVVSTGSCIPAVLVVCCLSGLLLMCSYWCCIVPGIPAMTWVSAVAAYPTAVEVSSATNVSNVSGGPYCCWRPYCCCLPCCCVLPPVAGVLISSHKDFSLRRCFYIWPFISSHYFKNMFKYSKICFS